MSVASRDKSLCCPTQSVQTGCSLHGSYAETKNIKSQTKLIPGLGPKYSVLEYILVLILLSTRTHNCVQCTQIL